MVMKTHVGAAIGVVVLGMSICVVGASMYMRGPADMAIWAETVHRCGLFVFVGGLIGLLAAKAQQRLKDTARDRPARQNPEMLCDTQPTTIAGVGRAAFAVILFLVVFFLLTGLSAVIGRFTAPV
jgi:hypothetical protein